MSFSFSEELDQLMALVRMKAYRRDGCVLYAKYEEFKPECTVTELVWGHCHNPCFARRLAREITARIPDFTQVLSKLRQTIAPDNIYPSFESAMCAMCPSAVARLDELCAQHVVFSTEGTHPHDALLFDEDIDRLVHVFNASDEDGELWQGLMVGEDWASGVDSVTIAILGYEGGEESKLWEHRYSHASVLKRVHERNGVHVFEPFKNVLPLLNMDIKLVMEVTYLPYAPQVEDVKQLFGITSTDFCTWMDECCFEIRLSKSSDVVLMNLPERTVRFVRR